METPCSSKAEQLERDLGFPHPQRLLTASLRRRDGYKEVTSFQRSVARQRLAELGDKGYSQDDALLILLMRGSRIEVLANAFTAWPHQIAHLADVLAERAKARLRALSEIEVDALIGEAQATAYIWRRV